jgi:macrolide transport system ATP-binding/permease protein
MNGGEIILADEPTGALDSSTGRTVLELIKDLHAQGHTIIMVTHDMDVAEHAGRIIEIRDGQIFSDRQQGNPPAEAARFEPRTGDGGYFAGVFTRFAEAAKIALNSIAAHRLRSSLTLFGIVVGILAVISVVALGEGGRRIVLDQINSLGANSISILPGKGWDDPTAKTLDTLTSDDAAALQKQSYVTSVSPLAKDSGQLMFENRAVDGVINGVSNAYFDVAQRPIARGGRFASEDDRQPLQEAIIDDNARKTLFGEQRNPLGEILVVKGAPFVIVGIIGELSGSLGQDKRPQIFIPYMSLSARITGSQRLSEILVRINPDVTSDVAESAMVSLLEKRHGTRDFFTFNSDQMRQTIETTTRTFSILVIAIAAVALLVGGVGVMNIMLVSVTERTAEIGLRMAVGARPSDIKLQFLIEALAITFLGSAAGVALAFGFGSLTWTIESPIPMVITFKAVATGCLMATLIGVVFGFFPARKAARLRPVQALAHN